MNSDFYQRGFERETSLVIPRLVSALPIRHWAGIEAIGNAFDLEEAVPPPKALELVFRSLNGLIKIWIVVLIQMFFESVA